MNALARLVLFAIVLVSGGCTTLLDENRRTLDLCDAHLAPDSATARCLLSPIALPTGLVAGIVDTVAVNPVCAIDDAWDDTHDLLWVSREESTLRRVLFTPFAALATPVVFGTDWVFRSIVPVKTRSRSAPLPDVPDEPDAPVQGDGDGAAAAKEAR